MKHPACRPPSRRSSIRTFGPLVPLLTGLSVVALLAGDFELPPRSGKRWVAPRWEQAGRPEGRDKEFWRQAENELRIEREKTTATQPSGGPP